MYADSQRVREVTVTAECRQPGARRHADWMDDDDDDNDRR